MMILLVILAFFALSRSSMAVWFGSDDASCSPPCVPGDESIMSPKEHGTSHKPVQSDLRWKCSAKIADQICNYNRHYAEQSGYWLTTTFMDEIDMTNNDKPVTFYDSNTGKPLFRAPVSRPWQDFLKESRSHGWPSFRDAEVIWDNVRVLPGGETVSVDGTHLGHNLPDANRRYCINLVSIAGNPIESAGRRDL
jgi:peptide methionine sulfoxide reductase MsrB